MKVLLNWKRSTFFSLLVILTLGIVLTGRTKQEELSKFGKTDLIADYATTHIHNMDINLQTPKEYHRYFPDTSNAAIGSVLTQYNMQFFAISASGKYAIELYLLENISTTDSVTLALTNVSESNIQKANWLNIATIEEATEQQKKQLCSYVEHFLTNQPDYLTTSELNMEYVTLGNQTYLRTAYTRKDKTTSEYNVVLDYITIINGYLLEFSDYYMSEQEPDTTEIFEELHNTFDMLQSNVTSGNNALSSSNSSHTSDGFLAKFLSFTFAISLLAIPLVYLFLCNITYAKNPRWHDDVLSLEHSKTLLGFFSLLIVIHHLAQSLGEASGIFMILEDFGVGLVAGFFFFSGYGLFLSYRQKPDYLHHFFKKRYPAILIPFYVCILIFILITIIQSGLPNITTLLSWLTGWILINTHMWYIVEIALFYAAFYLCFRYIQRENAAIIAMGIFIIGFTCFSLILGHGTHWFQGEWWYNTSFVFWIGIVFAKYKERIITHIHKYYHLWLIGTVIAFLALYKATKYMLSVYSYWSETDTNPAYLDKFRCLSVQLPMVILFILLILIIGMKIQIGNRAMAFLGRLSLELYLIHNLFIKNLSGISGAALYALAVIVSSILTATLLHKLDVWLICKLTHSPMTKCKKIEIHWKKYIVNMRLRTDLLLKYMHRHPMRCAKYIGRTLICIFLCLLSIFPIYILLINATRTSSSMIQGISLLPEGQFITNLNSFQELISSFDTNLYMAIYHSCLISVCVSLLASYFGTMCAYGFELFSFKWKKPLWSFIIAALMISSISSFQGFYTLVCHMNMLNSYLPIILPSIATPSTAFFVRMYLKTLHLNEIVEAARIDGCSEFGIFNRIALPAIKPAFLLQIIFTFVNSWNNTFYQSMIIYEPKKKTISLFLHILAGNNGSSNNPVIYVILLLTTLPPIIIYILCIKGVVSRIVLGAVKE